MVCGRWRSGWMRTPNCECCICGKPLYRRPYELRKVRHVACMAHRAEAQVRSGITEAQKAGLTLGRQPGTNHRTGYRHREESKQKAAMSHKVWCAANPEKVRVRGEKTRGEKHYRWKGGASTLNAAIRRMPDFRRWAKAVRDRDGRCVVCGVTENLEAHHITPFAAILAAHEIANTDTARSCAPLWDASNGETLCQKCHCARHGRTYSRKGSGRRASR